MSILILSRIGSQDAIRLDMDPYNREFIVEFQKRIPREGWYFSPGLKAFFLSPDYVEELIECGGSFFDRVECRGDL